MDRSLQDLVFSRARVCQGLFNRKLLSQVSSKRAPLRQIRSRSTPKLLYTPCGFGKDSGPGRGRFFGRRSPVRRLVPPPAARPDDRLPRRHHKRGAAAQPQHPHRSQHANLALRLLRAAAGSCDRRTTPSSFASSSSPRRHSRNQSPRYFQGYENQPSSCS